MTSTHRSRTTRRALPPLFLSLLVLACSDDFDRALSEASRELARQIKEENVSSVTVADLADLDERPTGLGRLIGQTIASHLSIFADGAFRHCDRSRIQRWLDEMYLDGSGFVDREQVRQVGKLCGVEAVVWGRLTPVDEELKGSLFLTSVETGEDLWSKPLVLRLTDDRRALAERNVEPPPTLRLMPYRPKEGGDETLTVGGDVDDNLPQVHRLGGLEIRLRECRFEEHELKCRLTIRNQDEGVQQVSILGTTRLIDNQRDEYRPLRVTIGLETAVLDRDDASLRRTLNGRSELAAEILFTTVSRHERKAHLLSVNLGEDGVARFQDFFFDRDPL